MVHPVLAMHIPDGFLSLPVSALGWLLLIVMLGFALRQTREQFGERQTPLLGILAACVFAAQMINFPVTGGTSGHLLGATLVAILLGPWAAVLVMTCVIGVQALLFQDGGLLALGANVFNMGIISGFIGYGMYRLVGKLLGKLPSAQFISAGVGAWLGVVLASAVCALELAISGTSPLNIALPAMVGIHALIGIGEALITVSGLAFIRQTRPDLLYGATPAATRGYRLVVGLLIAIGIAFLSPLASHDPDGLDSVAIAHGFSQLTQNAPYQILPNYTVPLIQNGALTTIVAGTIGVLVVIGLVFGLMKVVKKAQPEQSDEPLSG